MADKKRTVICLAVLMVLTWLITGCSEKNPQIIFSLAEYDPYSSIAMSEMSGYDKEYEHAGVFSNFGNGRNVAEVFDAQAVTAIKQNVGKYWYPQFLATVVIGVDRDRTDADIAGWNDLFDSELETGWNYTNAARVLIYGTLGYVTEGRNFTLEKVMELLHQQFEKGCFKENAWDTPLMVCFDYQIVQLNRQGRNIDIVLPEEGTLSFAQGLMSNDILKVPSDEALLAGGLRLMDGRSRDNSYPYYTEYDKKSERLHDFGFIIEPNANIGCDIRRKVRNTRLYSSADGRESIIFAVTGSIIAILWMGYAMHRSIRRDVQRSIMFTAIMIVCWLLLRLFKYQIYVLSTVNRMCWYGYYIFIMGLPFNMLYLASMFDKPERNGKPSLPLAIWGAGGLILLLLVLTNDFHMLVFRFDPASNWADDYSYGTAYYLIAVFCIVSFITSIAILIIKSWKSPKHIGWFLPTGFGFMIIAYCMGYAYGIPFARDSDFTMTFCTFALIFFETALRTGLIPSNTRYDFLFESSQLNMQLLDRRGKTILAGSSAPHLSPVLRMQLISEAVSTVSLDEDKLLCSRNIRGGTVVWQEDMTAINRLHHEIEQSVERMEAANTLLSREGDISRHRMAADVKAELFSSLESEIDNRTRQLSQAIADLPKAENRQKQTAYITLLLCCIKRRCNLFFLAKEGESMAGDEIAMYLDELSEFSGYAGTKALVRCSLHSFMKVEEAALCYDFYYSVLAWSVQNSGATILGQLEQQGDGIQFRILSSENPDGLTFTSYFEKRVKAAGGRVYTRELEESAGIYLSFPGGGAAE